jgi:hypothetical protein
VVCCGGSNFNLNPISSAIPVDLLQKRSFQDIPRAQHLCFACALPFYNATMLSMTYKDDWLRPFHSVVSTACWLAVLACTATCCCWLAALAADLANEQVYGTFCLKCPSAPTVGPIMVVGSGH